MRFDQSHAMRMSQQMKLAPHMIQSMEILQMSQAELEERIEQELESNPTLELNEGDPSPDNQPENPETGERTGEGIAADVDLGAADLSAPLKVDEGSGTDDFERLESYEESNPEAAANEFDDEPARVNEREYDETRNRAADNGEPDAKLEAMANTAARRESPQEQLEEQWRFAEVEPVLKPLGDAIIGYLGDDGYLRTPFSEIIAKLPPGVTGTNGAPVSAELMERALRAVQLLLEPAGIAARDLRECLLLQIDAREAEEADADDVTGWEQVRTIIEHHLEDLDQNRIPRIMQKTGFTKEVIEAAVRKLRQLNRAPGRGLIEESERPITPDAIVEYDAENDRYFAYLNDRRMPNLRVMREYELLAKDKTAEKKTREFVKTNLGNANFLLEAIQQRQRTIKRVVDVVVSEQREFFDYGPQAIKPLPMTKVAERLGIHVATVSRAVAEKYLDTPRGIVALRKFFTGGTTTESGEEVSWDAIKASMQEVIDAEDKANPLSDDQIAEELDKKGFKLARRTVAKYRGQLGIPTGRLRKTY